MPDYLLDVVLVAVLVGLAWRSLASTQPITVVVLFIIFGLALSLAWGRLGAPDIALAEAAVGAGLTGGLLIKAVGYLRRARAEGPPAERSGEHRNLE